MSKTSKAVIEFSRENLLEQYLDLPEDQREQKFPTTERAAKLIGVSRRTIQFWVDAGDIEAIFVGRNYRVNFDSLVTYLKSRVNGRKHS
jgi:excisionase family DNA binding protein